MSLWNLSSLDELETPVLSASGASASRQRSVSRSQYRTSSIKTVIQVAAFAAISYSVMVSGNADILTISQPTNQTACNVDTARPPLEALFGGRFDDRWTRAREEELLAKAVKKSASSTNKQDFFNFVHTSQHETVSGMLHV